MPVAYVGEIHSEAFNIKDAGDGGMLVQGRYRGQDVALHPKTKSLVEEATEMEDYVVIRRQEKLKLKDREIRDKKRIAEQKRLLTQYVSRIERRDDRQKQSNRQYQECADRLKRLKQQAKVKGNGDLSIDGRDLSELILEEAANSFSDVTEQDNILEYFEALEDLESGEAESENRQIEKTLKRLEGRTDERSVKRRETLQKRRSDLSDQTAFSAQFRQKLAAAKETLRGVHGQEIKDGYNLLPKATDLFASYVDGSSASGEDRVRTVANLYQKALCTENLVDLMRMSYSQFGEKNWKAGLTMMLELCGVDIKSADPSRNPRLLMAIRDLIYRVITARELYEWVKKLRKKTLNFLGLLDEDEGKDGRRDDRRARKRNYREARER